MIALSYSLIHGATEKTPEYFFGIVPEKLAWIPETVTKNTAHQIQTVGTIIFFVLPFCYLLLHQIRIRRLKSAQTVFLLGTLLFGISMSAASVMRNFALIYPGAFISGCVWIAAVFHDVRTMKGKEALLKEELQLLVQSGKSEKLSKLLSQLEANFGGNLELYKMQVREILLMLTQTGIAAGGNPQKLIQRSGDLEQKINESTDIQDIQRIVSENATEVTTIISEASQSAIEKAVKFINENFERDLSVDEIAESQNLSKYYFMRLFKQSMGKSTVQYLKELRIERAKELLKTKTITETAFAVGYNNSNYFSTVFKTETGMTPTQFQTTLQSDKKDHETICKNKIRF